MPQTIPITTSEVGPRAELDRRFMTRALELSEKGTGKVSPGPLVGCVIANDVGEIIGEGFYLFEHLKHAETYALEQAGPKAKGATAYVSLEPHAHHGRTPPCTDALINAGISRVLAPIEDPNPKVSGKGFAHLRSANVEVAVGLMAAEALRVNEKYVHFMRTGRPFVHLKLAASLDGKIATRSGDSKWITGEAARERVHELRHENDAILVGAGTAVADDPLLTDRSGRERRRPLVRVVLDQRLTIKRESQLASTANEFPLVIFADSSPNADVESLASQGIEVIRDTNGRNLLHVLNALGQREIQSVLVEGGAGVAGKFLDAGLVDKVSFFIAPTIIGGSSAPVAVGGEGVAALAEAFDLEDLQIVQRGRDIEVTGYPRRRNAR
ncbi:MAG TPA: bifunctional diaminohydroxyphosphoribosylaminopyrimidine deaminase/5-amino-6-(5-phosphoribosylamino)uracil reductase RibD [Pyrinomonadaceae bacterium]|nr:bifunctional diaminohydroxyphosphoribosylaminopyrimidine deaminase/5-amino-6-(5-phosphoribosylamino)uracil reductase RibD [Pyrinomonadaceae bacterium]